VVQLRFGEALDDFAGGVPSLFRLSRWVISLLRLLAYTLLLFLFIVLSVIISVAGTLVKAVGWWWEKLKKEPIAALVILLTVWGLGAAIDAGVSRVLSPETVVLISPFELATTPPKVLPITGKTAAARAATFRGK
jgi:hypothetical protein